MEPGGGGGGYGELRYSYFSTRFCYLHLIFRVNFVYIYYIDVKLPEQSKLSK